jgi:hypothetical protein
MMMRANAQNHGLMPEEVEATVIGMDNAEEESEESNESEESED